MVNKGIFKSKAGKAKKSLLGAAYGTPKKKKEKYKKPTTGYSPASKSMSLK